MINVNFEYIDIDRIKLYTDDNLYEIRSRYVELDYNGTCDLKIFDFLLNLMIDEYQEYHG